MRIIQHPEFEVASVDGDPTRRRLRVSYDLVTAGADESVIEVSERVVVHAVDRPGGVIPPSGELLLDREATYAAPVATVHRTIEATVSRQELDVEQDWWRTDLDGEVQAVAEWVDYLVGEIQVKVDGQVIDEATTKVISGSWGVLGAD